MSTFYRSLPVALRGLNEETREATFVASTEKPVQVGMGYREVLRHGGADLGRYRSNPVFLDTHNGSTIDNVLGSASRVQVVDTAAGERELEVVARFATTGKGARAWDLVKQGHVRTVSIGYRVDPASVRRIQENETDGQGAQQVRGPAIVVNKWELTEVSLVPVPADKDAVLRRAIYGLAPQENVMSQQAAEVVEQFQAPEIRQLAAPVPAAQAAGQVRSVFQAAVAAQAQAASIQPPAPPPAPPVAVPQAAPAASPAAPQQVRSAADEVVRAQAIRALAPASCRDLADRLVLEGKSVDEARAAFLAALTGASAPVGTPEAPVVQQRAAGAAPNAAAWPADLSNERLLASLKRNF